MSERDASCDGEMPVLVRGMLDVPEGGKPEADMAGLSDMAVRLMVLGSAILGGPEGNMPWVGLQMVRALLGGGEWAGRPTVDLVLYRRGRFGLWWALTEADRRTCLEALLQPLAQGVSLDEIDEVEGLAVELGPAFGAFDFVGCFRQSVVSAGAVAELDDSAESPAAADAANADAAAAEPAIYVPPSHLGWPRTGRRPATAEELDELFRMMHKYKMTGEEMCRLSGLRRQRIAQLIGGKQAPYTQEWPTDWRPSDELLIECGLKKPPSAAALALVAS